MSDEPDPPERTDVSIWGDHSGDYVLKGLTDLTQEVGMEIDLTVIASGLVVTGLLVSRDQWFEILRDQGREIGGAAEVTFSPACTAV